MTTFVDHLWADPKRFLEGFFRLVVGVLENRFNHLAARKGSLFSFPRPLHLPLLDALLLNLEFPLIHTSSENTQNSTSLCSKDLFGQAIPCTKQDSYLKQLFLSTILITLGPNLWGVYIYPGYGVYLSIDLSIDLSI